MLHRADDLQVSRFRPSSDNSEKTAKSENFPKNNSYIRAVGNAAPAADFERQFKQAEKTAGRTARGRLAARASIPKEDLREFLEEWLAECAYNGQSPETIKGKKGAIERFLWWMDREEVLNCTATEIKMFLAYLANSHLSKFGRWDEGLRARELTLDSRRDPKAPAIKAHSSAFREISARSIQLYFVYIKGFLGFLSSEEIGLIPASPLELTKQPRAKRASIKPFCQEEVMAIMRAALRSPSPKRNVALIYLLLDAGPRVSEVAGLRQMDVNLKSGFATVVGKGDKEREICFEGDTRRVLNAYLKVSPCAPEDPFFRAEGGLHRGQGLTASGITQIIKDLGREAGITSKRCSPHTFRHTFATEFLKSGGSAKALQMLLGHEGMDMSFRYVTLATADIKNQHRLASPARILRTPAQPRK